MTSKSSGEAACCGGNFPARARGALLTCAANSAARRRGCNAAGAHEKTREKLEHCCKAMNLAHISHDAEHVSQQTSPQRSSLLPPHSAPRDCCCAQLQSRAAPEPQDYPAHVQEQRQTRPQKQAQLQPRVPLTAVTRQQLLVQQPGAPALALIASDRRRALVSALDNGQGGLELDARLNQASPDGATIATWPAAPALRVCAVALPARSYSADCIRVPEGLLVQGSAGQGQSCIQGSSGICSDSTSSTTGGTDGGAPAGVETPQRQNLDLEVQATTGKGKLSQPRLEDVKYILGRWASR
jgi:hypothetical protein